MLKNYVIIALRNLRRQKGYAFINVAGLALGLTCCLLIFQYAAYETSFDTFNKKKDRIFRVAIESRQDGVDQGFGVTTGYIFGPTMAQEVPGIARFTRVHPIYGDAVVSYQGNGAERTFLEVDVLFVDSTFLSMFDYSLVRGERTQALRQPQMMLISERTARKYFGIDEPVGKTVTFTSSWAKGPYTVAGVFEDVPPTSHLRFEILLPMEDLLRTGRFDQGGLPWGWQNFLTYFELEPAADAKAVEAAITETYLKYRGEQSANGGLTSRAFLEPLTDIHLNGIGGPATVTGDRRTVYFFTVIGVITLLIAFVNYVNLATARAFDRAREVGVRKVVGAKRMQLVGQFLMESSVTNGMALVLAIGLSLFLLPVVNRVTGVEIPATFFTNGWFWGSFLSIFVAGALLSGLYPAFVLSSFRPAAVLKGKAGELGGRAVLRKGLVVVQFAASIALLSGTVIVYAQLGYIRDQDTGLDLEQVLVVEGPRVRSEGADGRVEMTTLKQELRKIPAVREIGLSTTTPGRGFQFDQLVYRETDDPSTTKTVRGTGIDHEFGSVYGIELIAGEDFREGMAVRDGGYRPVLVNEALVRTFDFASNEDAVGTNLVDGSGGGFHIRGVVEDFQWSSAHTEVEEVLLYYEPENGNISMKVNTAGIEETIAAVEMAYRMVFPGNPFNYYFADAAFDEQYRADRRFATLFAGFAGIAIVIACLGLFGLAAFAAEQRTKEIGVRKVLGASVASIVGLLSMDFLKLVVFAFVLAVPVAFFAMQRWLENFAYRIEIGPGVFLLAGVASLLIALATVSYQAIRAAMADPVESLRYE